MSNRTVLFVDDDPGILKTAELLLRKAGYDFRAASSPVEAYAVLAAEPIDAVFLDLNYSRAQMSGEEGLACLRQIIAHDPGAAVIVVTGHSGLTVAVQALRSGARNFIMKPWNNERLLSALDEVLDQSAAAPRLTAGSDVPESGTGGLLVGDCEAIQRIRDLAARYAPMTASVLIRGENGAGKSLLAEALHRQSSRRLLKVIEASTLSPSDLDETEDATVVLENIDALEVGRGTALGLWLQEIPARNTRVVATSSLNAQAVAMPRALHYALSTLEIVMPPLRDRGQDIELLAHHFARVFALRQGMAAVRLTPDAVAALRGASWPDNLHALRRVVERAVAAASRIEIYPDDLDLPKAEDGDSGGQGLNLELTEKIMITEALGRHNFNISKAATELGVTRQTLYRRMARHGL